MLDTLFSDVAVAVIAPIGQASEVLRNHYVGVCDGRIAYLGADKPGEPAREVIGGKNKLLMPGLVNAHTHIPMAAFKGWGDGHDLHTWLQEYIFPCEDRLDGQTAAICARLGLAEAIASGTTAIADMYNFYDQVAPAIAESGVSANLSRGILNLDPSFDFYGSASFQETKELVGGWHGHDDGRIVADIAIHGEYTSGPRVWEPTAEYAREQKLGIHLHLSETRAEHEGSIERHGKTPAAVLAEHGVFENRVLAAHCVWVAESDMELLAATGASAVHSPVSNLKLASGVAGVPAMLDKGVNVALGTDGVSSNDSLDMFEEIKFAAILHRGVSLEPTVMGARAALAMATVNGAKALGRADTGRIAAGMRADLILIDMDKPHLYPRHDELALLGYAARGADVCLTMARGRTLYKNGEWLTIDVERAKAELASTVLPRVFPGF